jgi:hypothetical protein
MHYERTGNDICNSHLPLAGCRGDGRKLRWEFSVIEAVQIYYYQKDKKALPHVRVKDKWVKAKMQAAA